jgi:Phospholipid methyltransferase
MVVALSDLRFNQLALERLRSRCRGHCPDRGRTPRVAGGGDKHQPFKPTMSIVTPGPFRFTRNPLYLGVTLIYCGLALVSNTWWCFVLLVPVLLLIHLGVVTREERYLERKFGDSYRQYRARVRRYL